MEQERERVLLFHHVQCQLPGVITVELLNQCDTDAITASLVKFHTLCT